MTFIIVRVKVSSKLNKNINIQTRQVLKQNGKSRDLSLLQRFLATKFADFIRYEEQIEDAKVNVTIKIEDSGVKLIRKGDINMNLHFVEGHETTTLYDVPTGKIPLTVKTLSLMHFVTHNGGKLKIHYELYQDEQKMGSYQYEINYKEISE